MSGGRFRRCLSAPLNPAYRQDEFEFYMKDLGAALAQTVTRPVGVVKAIVRSQWNDRSHAGLGPSRGDPVGPLSALSGHHGPGDWVLTPRDDDASLATEFAHAAFR
jgi:hypothetical protein